MNAPINRNGLRKPLAPRLLAAAAGLALLGLAGCNAREEPPLVTQCKAQMSGTRLGKAALVGEEYGPQMTPIPLDSVQFSQWSSALSVVVQHLASHRTPTDTVAVSARFVSCADQPLAIRVRTSFLDAQQSPAEEPSAWQVVHLQPHLTAVYSELSTSKAPAQYLIEVTPD